jgi:hypothetical protein
MPIAPGPGPAGAGGTPAGSGPASSSSATARPRSHAVRVDSSQASSIRARRSSGTLSCTRVEPATQLPIVITRCHYMGPGQMLNTSQRTRTYAIVLASHLQSRIRRCTMQFPSPRAIVKRWLTASPPREVSVHSPLPVSECARRLSDATTPDELRTTSFPGLSGRPGLTSKAVGARLSLHHPPVGVGRNDNPGP